MTCDAIRCGTIIENLYYDGNKFNSTLAMSNCEENVQRNRTAFQRDAK